MKNPQQMWMKSLKRNQRPRQLRLKSQEKNRQRRVNEDPANNSCKLNL
jgi:hypothetical protein